MNRRKKIRYVNIKQIDNGFIMQSYVGAENPKEHFVSEEQEKFCKTFTDALYFASEVELSVIEYNDKLEQIQAI